MADTHHDIEAEIPRLRRYARALTRDVVSADDLVQDCLTRALGKLHLWQEGSDLRAWLFTILHNQYVNHIRRAVREGAVVALNETEPMLSRGTPFATTDSSSADASRRSRSSSADRPRTRRRTT